jgi:predicted transport protein
MAAPKCPADAEATMVANLDKTTGRSLDAWLALLKDRKGEKHGAIVASLKSDHGMTHGYANLVAHKLLKSDAGSAADDGTDLVAAQYAGAKAPLRPIHDRLRKAIAAFGGDAEFAPKKAYVSVRRSKQFAIIQPSTATRLDLGLNLKNVDPVGRLEAAGTWNTMVTHRVKLATESDVDGELIAWIKQAYDRA